MPDQLITINENIASKLIKNQFPEWSDLLIRPVAQSGWDNRTFHLGDELLLRFPSKAMYAPQVLKEQHWLPRLASHLPLQIPQSVAMGEPSDVYPWHWSIYKWLKGEPASLNNIDNITNFAEDLAKFLVALQGCDITNGPQAGPENFYRGGVLSHYEKDTRDAIANSHHGFDANLLTAIWDQALASTWQQAPVWVHGDVALGNLLVKEGKIVAVIDFGQLAIGDPACDLAVAWTLFVGQSRDTFRNRLQLDDATWQRARGWVLWKTLCAPVAGTDCHEIIGRIL